MIVFFFNDTATTEIYTLSLHDALPIWLGGAGAAWSGRSPGAAGGARGRRPCRRRRPLGRRTAGRPAPRRSRSEEHTSELQSRQYLVCRLLLEKKHKSSELDDSMSPTQQ